MSATREQIIETTCSLIEKQGYNATGLNEIVRESGAPKGSLYYYFPEGKDQITEEAIEWAGKMISERSASNLDNALPPRQAIPEFVRNIAYHVEASGFCAGGPLQTVALETATTSERLNLACRAAYDRLMQVFETHLRQGGYTPAEAVQLALTITAAVEGGVLLSRVYHTGDPLRTVAASLETLLTSRQTQ